jgi:hypothetical protein
MNNRLVLITAIFAIIAICQLGLATVYPSYDNATDCRGCHGNDNSTTIPTPATRHHLLVVNGIYQCTDCHPVIYNNVTQTYSTQIIRDCLVCHVGKNHTNIHHILTSQGLFVCSDCHPVVFNNQTGTYSVQVTFDCPVCHSTVLSIQNGTPVPTPAPTPVINSSPTITNFSPISPVNNIVGDSASFEIMTDQIVNVIWLINNTQVQSDTNVNDAIYINISAPLGTWNVSAIASNINGSVTCNWTWNVTSSAPIIPPKITGYLPISSPVYDTDGIGTQRKFGISSNQIANITWYINNSQVQFNQNVPLSGVGYTNTSPAVGTWIVNAMISNVNGTVSYSWTWIVSPVPPITTIDPPNGQNGWYKTNTIYLNATDPDEIRFTNYSVDGGTMKSNTGSGTSYKTPVNISNGIHSIEYYSVSNYNGIESNKIQTVYIDNTSPQIIIYSPVNGSIYRVNQKLIANWSVSDNTSGIATAIGTYPNGTIINTKNVGTKIFSVSATDNAGNNVTKNVTYYIQHKFNGYNNPIKMDGSTIFKQGSIVPINFNLTDANGNYDSSAVATLNSIMITTNILGTNLVSPLNSTNSTGNLFIYNSTGNAYMYNLSTKNMRVGTWRITTNLDDGTSYSVNISIKK